jgi:hypothetical protein
MGRGIFLLILLHYLPTRAELERPKVVVLEFKGEEREKIQTQAKIVFFEKMDIVPESDLDSMIKKLNIEPKGPQNLAKLGTSLKVIAIIQGNITKKGKKYILEIKIRNTKDGDVIGITKIGPFRLAKAKRHIKIHLKEILDYINQLRPKVSEPKVIPSKVEERSQKAPEEIQAQKQVIVAKPLLKKKPRLEFFNLGLWITGMWRDLEIPIRNTDLIREYDGKLYPAMGFKLYLFPAVFFYSPLSSLGIGVDYSFQLKNGALLEEPEIQLNPKYDELNIFALYTWKILNQGYGPFIDFFAGFGMLSFTLAENPLVPSFEYHHLFINLKGGVPLEIFGVRGFLGRGLGIFLGSGASFVLKIGESGEVFGHSFSSYAYNISFGAYGNLFKGLYYRLSIIEFLKFNSSFKGEGRRPIVRGAEIVSGVRGDDSYWRLLKLELEYRF